MRTIDVQVHAYEHNHPARPWAGVLHGPASANIMGVPPALPGRQ